MTLTSNHVGDAAHGSGRSVRRGAAVNTSFQRADENDRCADTGEKIRHTGCPVMTWMLSNTVAKANAKEEVYPRKLRDEDKIDGVVAMLMAMGRALAGGEVSTEIESGFVLL